MIKKLISATISLIFLATLTVTVWPLQASADTLKVCKLEDLEKYLTKQAKEDLTKTLQKDDGDSNNLKYRIAFEKARTMYHDTVKCVFDASTIAILGSAAGIGTNLKKDDLPSLTRQVLAELNEPDKACLDDEKRNEVMNASDPSKLVPDLLAAYNQYSDFVQYIIDQLESNPDIDPTENDALASVSARVERLKLIMNNELQNAIVALDGAFIALKEMRRNFIMHVHFQCMMKNLEAYRKLFSNLRKVITTLPSVIQDASMHK